MNDALAVHVFDSAKNLGCIEPCARKGERPELGTSRSVRSRRRVGTSCRRTFLIHLRSSPFFASSRT